MLKIKFITLERLLEMRVNGETFKLVEVLNTEEFQRGHLPGAINLPLDRLEKDAGRLLKKNEAIVVYCASYHCQASTEAARKLLKMGYNKTVDYKAGKKGWVRGNLELER